MNLAFLKLSPRSRLQNRANELRWINQPEGSHVDPQSWMGMWMWFVEKYMLFLFKVKTLYVLFTSLLTVKSATKICSLAGFELSGLSWESAGVRFLGANQFWGVLSWGSVPHPWVSFSCFGNVKFGNSLDPCTWGKWPPSFCTFGLWLSNRNKMSGFCDLSPGVMLMDFWVEPDDQRILLVSEIFVSASSQEAAIVFQTPSRQPVERTAAGCLF